MKSSWLLAWRYSTHYLARTLILIACVALVAFLPLAVEILVGRYEVELRARAVATPAVIGAPGSRLDLLMSALYYRGQVRQATCLGAVRQIERDGLGVAIPVHFRHRARGYPLVGTHLEYFGFRKLALARGRLPGFLGEAVVGSTMATDAGIEVGDALLTDVENLWDMAASYPLELRVVGIFEAAGTPDDGAVFVDLRTAWIVEGIGHGHQALDESSSDAVVLNRGDGEVTASAAVKIHTAITPENVDSFHFHGDEADFPVTAVILVPRDAKSGTILRARFRSRDDLQLLDPGLALEELMGIVFRVKRFFDANFILVGIATSLLFVLVVWLTRRVRAREFETLFRIGCRRRVLFAMQVWELVIIVGLGLGVALFLAATLWAPLSLEVCSRESV